MTAAIMWSVKTVSSLTTPEPFKLMLVIPAPSNNSRHPLPSLSVTSTVSLLIVIDSVRIPPITVKTSGPVDTRTLILNSRPLNFAILDYLTD